MSIKVMTKVWELSKHSGSKLLLQLAIADHANEDGVCWPGNIHLAKKCRLSMRHTKRLIEELIEEDEIKWLSGGTGGRGDKRVIQVSPIYLERVSPMPKKGTSVSHLPIENHKESLKDKPFSERPLTPIQRREMEARKRLIVQEGSLG